MHDHLIAPHGGTARGAHRHPRTLAGAAGMGGAVAVVGPVGSAALRCRAAAGRRLLSAAGLPRPGRLRVGLLPHAPGRRHPVADPGHPRRSGCRWRSTRSRRQARAPGPGRRSAGRPARRRRLAARPGGRSTAGARYLGRGPSRRRPPSAADGKLVRRRCRRGTGAAPALRLPGPAAHAGRAARRARTPRLGPGRRLPDPQPDAPGAPGVARARGPGHRRQPPCPPRGRPYPAG